MYLNKILKSSKVKDLYTNFPFPSSDSPFDTYFELINREIKFYSEYIKPRMTVLDAGCGTGKFTAVFAKIFPHTKFIGVDFSEKSIEKARDMFSKYPNLTFENHDLLNPFYNGITFDVIISLGVIHHLEDQVRGMQNFHKILSEDNGIVILYLYGKYGLFKRQIVRNIVLTLTQNHDWPQRFEILDLMSKDKRLEYFAELKKASRYWFIPERLKAIIRKILRRTPNRIHQADSFFHPIENLHTIKSILSLLETSGFKFLQFNEFHPGSFKLPEKLFDDPKLTDFFNNLNSIDKYVVAENLLRPISYTFAAKKIKRESVD